MKTNNKDERWLDDMLNRTIGSPAVRFDAEQFQRKLDQVRHPATKTNRKLNPNQTTIRRYIMKSSLPRIAATVIVVVGIIAMVNYFGTPGSSIAWADVARQVQQVSSFSYQMDMTMNGSMGEGMSPVKDMKINTEIIFSTDYGMKMKSFMNDQVAQEMVIDPMAHTALMVTPTAKQYQWIVFNEQFAEQMKQQMQDPRDMFKQLENCEYTNLGRDTIDGIEVEGIESTDPKIMGGMFDDIHVRIWVDTVDGWPVQMEFSMTTNNGQMEMTSIQKNFQWNIDIDPLEFEIEIPEDYTEMPAMNMPPMNEETAVAGLKKYLELTGRYPAKLNLMDMIQELVKVKKDLKLDNLGHSKADSKEDMNQYMEEMMPIQHLGMFYMQLVQQDKDPQYYGETVTPEDHDAVLLRWRSADDEYTVIYGDLSSETITAEQLKQMEK